MAFEDSSKCAHIKVNGGRCQCPAMKRGKYCVFHSRARQQTRRIQRKNAQARFVVPVLEDPRSIQLALSQVVEMLAAGKMDPKVAGTILYALQTASNNLRSPGFAEADPNDKSKMGLAEYLLRAMDIPFEERRLSPEELKELRQRKLAGARSEIEGARGDRAVKAGETQAPG